MFFSSCLQRLVAIEKGVVTADIGLAEIETVAKEQKGGFMSKSYHLIIKAKSGKDEWGAKTHTISVKSADAMTFFHDMLIEILEDLKSRRSGRTMQQLERLAKVRSRVPAHIFDQNRLPQPSTRMSIAINSPPISMLSFRRSEVIRQRLPAKSQLRLMAKHNENWA